MQPVRGAKILRATLAAGLLAVAWLALESRRVGVNAAPFVRASVNELPEVDVGLVLGCSKQLGDGRPNAFFRARMSAAAELYRAGKVRYLLLSGDNSRTDYDEPSDMRRALVAAGVPGSRIVLDYAGFRTLDSVLRAKDVFGVRRLIVVSQRFHNERAVYLARAHGMEAFGFDARDIGGVEGLRVRLREVVSRMFAVLDVKVLHSEPRFPGPPELTPFGR
jgi:SanA protein